MPVRVAVGAEPPRGPAYPGTLFRRSERFSSGGVRLAVCRSFIRSRLKLLGLFFASKESALKGERVFCSYWILRCFV